LVIGQAAFRADSQYIDPSLGSQRELVL